MLDGCSTKTRREGVFRGAYVLRKESGDLETILLASGSEVQHAVAAAGRLGEGVRVVSVPCMERFRRQSDAYRDEVLPPTCRKRVAIEAGVSGLWWELVGPSGTVLGIDRFGISAPGGTVMKELGMTTDHVVDAVRALA
jgi:transketolase